MLHLKTNFLLSSSVQLIDSVIRLIRQFKKNRLEEPEKFWVKNAITKVSKAECPFLYWIGFY